MIRLELLVDLIGVDIDFMIGKQTDLKDM